MSIFSTTISVWSSTNRSADTRTEMTVGDFLNLGQHYLPTITRLRQWYDYALAIYPSNPRESERAFRVYSEGKARLPLATIGGLYANGGLAADILVPSNLICLDVDAPKPDKAAKLLAEGQPVPNANVTDWQRVKRQMSHLPWVAYAGLSVGGHGLFLVVPIDDYRMHAERWQAAAHLLKEHYGLTIDPQTKDINRPRFVSYDPAPHVNENAQVFSARLKPQPRTTITPSYAPTTHRTAPVSSAAEAAVMECIRQIESRHVDITSNYGDWCSIAAALNSEFGEAGENFFVRISQFYPGATESRSRRKYKQCRTMTRISIASFFKICSDHGIRHERKPILSAKATPVPSSTPTAAPSPAPASLPSPAPSPTPATSAAPSPSAAGTPATAAASTTADEPRITYRRVSLFPEPFHDVLSELTEAQFNEIFSPEVVAEWQESHPVPF